MIKRLFSSNICKKQFVPPNISLLYKTKPAEQQKASDYVQSIINLYQKMPKGKKPELKDLGMWERYHEKFKGSNAPFFHFIVSLFVIGYSVDYYAHLRN